MPNPRRDYKFKFCPMCADPLTSVIEGGRMRPTCPACGFIHYINPMPAAGCVIPRADKVLLVRRAVPPKRGDWTLPAGFIENDESAASCAVREVAEETGLVVAVSGLLGVYMGSQNDHCQSALLIVYHAREVSDDNPIEPIAGDDADAAEFFAPDNIPDNIAFRTHREALADFWEVHARRMRPSRMSQ